MVVSRFFQFGRFFASWKNRKKYKNIDFSSLDNFFWFFEVWENSKKCKNNRFYWDVLEKVISGCIKSRKVDPSFELLSPSEVKYANANVYFIFGYELIEKLLKEYARVVNSIKPKLDSVLEDVLFTGILRIYQNITLKDLYFPNFCYVEVRDLYYNSASVCLPVCLFGGSIWSDISIFMKTSP